MVFSGSSFLFSISSTASSASSRAIRRTPALALSFFFTWKPIERTPPFVRLAKRPPFSHGSLELRDSLEVAERCRVVLSERFRYRQRAAPDIQRARADPFE